MNILYTDRGQRHFRNIQDLRPAVIRRVRLGASLPTLCSVEREPNFFKAVNTLPGLFEKLEKTNTFYAVNLTLFRNSLLSFFSFFSLFDL